MGVIVVANALMMCPFGTTPSQLCVTSQSTILADGKTVATIQDSVPMLNIASFGMCSSLQNPQVAAATAAALGVLTPQPCMPAVTGTWAATQTKCLACGKPCLTNDSTIRCQYQGILKIVDPGQRKVKIK